MKSKSLQSLLVALFFFLAHSAKAQVDWDTLPYRDQADFRLQPLNKSLVTSGILYDRVLPIADIGRFKAAINTDTSGPRHWLQSYFELYNAAYNPAGWLLPDSLDKILDTLRYANAVPIGLLHYKYNVLDSNAYVDRLIDTLPNGQFVDVAGRLRSPYLTRRLLSLRRCFPKMLSLKKAGPILFT
ncbi:hypothetical protein HRH25_23200 [Flavisolibacter sp. BT320]|nr:hypothetical protein [Flavisolibacter longurius]